MTTEDVDIGVRDAGREALNSINVSDALGEESRRHKRNLMAFVSLWFVIDAYDLRLKQIPWLGVTVPENAPDFLPLLTFAGLLYFLLAYTLYASSDLLDWRHRFTNSYLRPLHQLLYRLNTHVRDLKSVHDATLGIGADKEKLKKIADDAQVAAARGLGYFDELVKQARELTRRKTFFAYAWELAVPCGLALLALWYLRDDVIPFLSGAL